MASDSHSARPKNSLLKRLYLFSAKPHLEWSDTQINLSQEQEAELRERYEHEKSMTRSHSEKSRDLETLRGKLGRNLNAAREEAQSSNLMTAPLLRQPRKDNSETDKSYLVTGQDADKVTQANPEYAQTDPGFEVKSLDAGAVARIEGDAGFLYAEGDDSTAESLLLGGVEEHPQKSRELYLHLLDLYHATGQRGQFDATAELFGLTYKERAPVWSEETAGSPSVTRRDSLTMDTVLTEAQAIDLFAYLENRISLQRDVTVDFSKLRELRAGAMPVLNSSLNMVNEILGDVYLLGVERLRSLLAGAQPEMGQDTAYWLARLSVERLRNDMNSFVAVARDASNAANIAGNTWTTPRCNVRAPLDLGSGLSLMAVDETGHQTNARPVPRNELSLNAISLTGTLKGVDVEAAMAARAPAVLSATQVIIDCTQLKRLDFEGGVALLNWISQWEADGKIVKLVQVNRLVNALLVRLDISKSTIVMMHTRY